MRRMTSTSSPNLRRAVGKSDAARRDAQPARRQRALTACCSEDRQIAEPGYPTFHGCVAPASTPNFLGRQIRVAVLAQRGPRAPECRVLVPGGGRVMLRTALPHLLAAGSS